MEASKLRNKKVGMRPQVFSVALATDVAVHVETTGTTTTLMYNILARALRMRRVKVLIVLLKLR